MAARPELTHDFEVAITSAEGSTIVRADGRADITSASRLLDALMEAHLRARGRQVDAGLVVDLSAVTRLDASCLTVLVREARRARDAGLGFVLRYPDTRTYGLLEAARLVDSVQVEQRKEHSPGDVHHRAGMSFSARGRMSCAPLGPVRRMPPSNSVAEITDVGARPMSFHGVAEMGDRLRHSVRAAVEVSEDTLDVVLATVFAGGHLLIEDHPGVGKTLLARALAGSVGGRLTRIQATFDLLPSDIVGANVWRPEEGRFQFQPGPVFANVVLVDEINRATPKTQSGLLEAMQEQQVTIDGETRPISAPFTVVATQNPTAGYDGTYALPPPSRDRFLARVSLGYPSRRAEIRLLQEGPGRAQTVATPEALLAAQTAVASVHASERLLRYVVDLLSYTREHGRINVGASPRAGVALLSAARARAALVGRDHVLVDDVKLLAPAVLAHRLQVAWEDTETESHAVVDEALRQVSAT